MRQMLNPIVSELSAGDPIESSAAAAMLGPDRLPGQPLLLAASKATFGHAEPAAGLVGMLQAAHGLQIMQQAPILHLITPNAMVAAALQNTLHIGIPRQAAPLAMPPTCVGTSAFAFQVGCYVVSLHVC